MDAYVQTRRETPLQYAHRIAVKAENALLSTFIRRSPDLLKQAEEMISDVRFALGKADEAETRISHSEIRQHCNTVIKAAKELINLAEQARTEAMNAPRLTPAEKAKKESDRREDRVTRSQAGPKGLVAAAPPKHGQGKKNKKGGRKAA